MKFCPYCGASLPGSAVSFCAECGEALPRAEETTNTRRPQIEKPAKSPARAKKKPTRAKRGRPSKQTSVAPKRTEDENYDGYYDDIQPTDAGQQEDHMDPDLIKRIVFLILGVVGVIALAIVLMSLL